MNLDDLDKILKYQDLDMQLHNIRMKLRKSEPNQCMDQAKNRYNNAKKTVQDADKDAVSMIEALDQANEQLEELYKKLDELNLIVENAESDDDLNGLADQLEALKGRAIALEKRILECRSESEKLVKEYQDANTLGLKSRKSFDSAKLRYTELTKKVEPEVTALKTQLKELEPQIDPETMKRYKSITSDNKYPAIVSVRKAEKNYYCNGCGTDLPQKVVHTLNESGFCVCETCRRIIYKRED